MFSNIPNPPAPLKLLYRLESGDKFFLRVRGLPQVLLAPTASVHFLRFERVNGLLRTQTDTLLLPAEVGEDDRSVRVLTGTIRPNTTDGMYLLSGVSVKAANTVGRILTAHLGDSFMPLEPRQGFCFGKTDWDLGLVDDSYLFLGMQLL